MKNGELQSNFRLGLIALGPLSEVAVRVVAANLQAVLKLPVEALPPQGIPESAFQKHRQQYDAGLIIKQLSAGPFHDYLKIAAVTSVDLCIPILTYVFGEAEMGGKVAVISDFRLRHNEDGSLAPLDIYYERLAKVALHEVAHTFTLYHCDSPTCLMHYCSKVRQLDQIELFFCSRCEFMLEENLKSCIS